MKNFFYESSPDPYLGVRIKIFKKTSPYTTICECVFFSLYDTLIYLFPPFYFLKIKIVVIIHFIPKTFQNNINLDAMDV